jgi:hypothetical protein
LIAKHLGCAMRQSQKPSDFFRRGESKKSPTLAKNARAGHPKAFFGIKARPLPISCATGLLELRDDLFLNLWRKLPNPTVSNDAL